MYDVDLDVGPLVAEGRRAAEALMVDQCTITAPASGSTFDPDTGTNVPNPGTVVYQGQCRIQVQQPQPAYPDSAGHRFTVEQSVLQIPVSATTPPIGAVVVVIGSADPANVGRRLRITSTFRKTHATAQRLMVEEVTE